MRPVLAAYRLVANRTTAVVRASKRDAADPLECPKCKGPMLVIALIDAPFVVREIPVHLGRWQPKAVERAPPVPPGAMPGLAGC